NTPQEKLGSLTVGSLTTAGNLTAGSLTTAGAVTAGSVSSSGLINTPTLRVTTGAAASRVLTSDASGNATWQAAAGGSDNLGDHTATQALSLGTNNIIASGADTTFGGVTLQGDKNGYGGINFKNTAGTTNYATLMVNATNAGFYNAAHNGWLWYANNTGDTTQAGVIYASDMYSSAPTGGFWMSASKPHGKQLFTANGTFTVPAGVTTIWVSSSGGSGGGGGANYIAGSSGRCYLGGSGGPSYGTFRQFSVTPSTSYAVTIGGGGAGGTTSGAPTAGGVGGTTSFGALVSLPGGNGGGAGTTSTAGVSGTPGGTLAHPGYAFSSPSSSGGTCVCIMGPGCMSPVNGAAGKAGFVLVEW
ncbi:MAG: hypothetical protein M0P64_04615, partial [Candidatus Pacebacteria bacterium]|nr:hypothetical protein [Candidatus Paceibacterota bacterium]